MRSQRCDQHFGRLSNSISSWNAPCKRPPMCSGFLSQQRKGDCFMRGPHYAGDTRSTCLQGRRDDETTVFSQLVSNSESAASLDYASVDPLFPVAHALTRSFMKEQSSSRATNKSDCRTHIEDVV